MFQQLRTSIVVLTLLTVLTGVAYPSLVTLVAQLTLPQQANGSILQVDGRAVGSEFVGQPFSRPENFWGRLSATAPFPYNAAASSGSNFGPLHPALVKNAVARIEALRAADPQAASIPVDLVTASGSGLDPHISPAAAEVQVRRVAAARKMTEDGVRELVRQNTEPRQLGVLGEPRVHVLRLNIALDALTHDHHSPRSR
jgi:K+-transporting ATPase ATPase C chain